MCFLVLGFVFGVWLVFLGFGLGELARCGF